MKIATLNFSGNVGKSMISQHLLLPRLDNAQLISVESINSDDVLEDTRIRGKEFGELMEALSLTGSAVADIGSSNVEEFTKQMRQYRGSHEDFDYYLVPSVPKQKQQRDTIATIESLSEIGIPASKIRLCFNMLELDDNTERVFAGLYHYHAQARNFTLTPEAVIHANDLFGKLRGAEQSIADILKNDPSDLKQQLKCATDATEKLRISRMLGLRRLALGVTEELDLVFATLFQ
jgi:hypothetical protein